jgi:hypothetical protein
VVVVLLIEVLAQIVASSQGGGDLQPPSPLGVEIQASRKVSDHLARSRVPGADEPSDCLYSLTVGPCELALKAYLEEARTVAPPGQHGPSVVGRHQVQGFSECIGKSAVKSHDLAACDRFQWRAISDFVIGKGRDG